MSNEYQIPPEGKMLLIGGEHDGEFIDDMEPGMSMHVGEQRYVWQKLILAKLTDEMVDRKTIWLPVADGEETDATLLERAREWAERFYLEQPSRFRLLPPQTLIDCAFHRSEP